MSEGTTQQLVVGIDIGGTFTDAVALDPSTGEIKVGKAPTTPGHEEDGAIAALQDTGVGLGQVAEIVHGHTVGLNAVLSRGGAKVGLLVTDGYRDLLDMGRLDRPYNHQFDPNWIRPHQLNPIVPRRRRKNIRERISADGQVLAPLDAAEVRSAVRELIAEDVDSFAICFVNSYLDLEHEQHAAAIVEELAPDAYIQTSQIHPLAKEAERTTTVVLDAYTGPLVIDYLDRLGRKLRENDFDGPIWIMGMNGGVAALEQSKARPINQLMSGPVGGVAHAASVSTTVGENLVTLDMGGTSTDVAVLTGGAPTETDHWTVEWGLDLFLPMLEINTVGSGAGSIISIGDTGNLTVGPRSAGSVPGPVCYGRGGTEPTLTDAFVARGLIRPEYFFGGRMKLETQAAQEALAALAERLELDVPALADAACRISVSHIAEAIRAISTYRGIDLKDYQLLAGGAAGPLLAGDVARELGMSEVLIARHPGQFSAFGLASADIRVSRATGVMRPLASFEASELDDAFKSLEAQARGDIAEQGVTAERVDMLRSFNGMYAGQTWDNVYPAPAGPYAGTAIADIESTFHSVYKSRTGSSSAELPIMMTALQLTAVVPRNAADAAEQPVGKASQGSSDAFDAWWGDRLLSTRFVQREGIAAGDAIHGPAVVVEPYATTSVPPGSQMRAGQGGQLQLTWSSEERAQA
jgi:N-methylhydantoinase A